MSTNYREQLTGIFPPNMTCFINEEVAYDKIRMNIEKYEQTGIRGYFPLGSNGEFRSLTDEESLRVVDVYRKFKGKDKVLMAGVARESAKATVEFIKKVADLGVEYATILPPNYFVGAMKDDVLLKYFNYVADLSPIPIVLYNAPKFAQGLRVNSAAMRQANPALPVSRLRWTFLAISAATHGSRYRRSAQKRRLN